MQATISFYKIPHLKDLVEVAPGAPTRYVRYRMSKFELIVEDLKTLPPERLDRAADYIHRLRTITDAERQAIIDRTSGSLTPQEADELAQIIHVGCEQIDE